MPPVKVGKSRRPRFRRADTVPPFRLTDGDLEIVRLLRRHRFLRSTQIALLVGRSLDRTNHRLSLLFHARYLDRPRAQLDRFPTNGSSHMVYALANEGARLLKAYDGMTTTRPDVSQKNKSALRPFIEHQLEIMDFYVALQSVMRKRTDVTLIHPEEIVAAFPEKTRANRHPLKLKVKLSDRGEIREFGLIPDLVFGLRFQDGSRRCFCVEIDCGTMPVTRSNMRETSFALKMRCYLAAHASGEHEHRFGWKNFRVLTITTDQKRAQSIAGALRKLHMPAGPGASLFFFVTRYAISHNDPLSNMWRNGNGRETALI